MITQKIITTLYHKCPRPPRDFASLEIEKFMAACGELYGISLNETHITFEKMDADNPFRSILSRSLCGVVDFEEHIALITPTYILFFGREQYSVDVHLKPETPSLWKRLCRRFAK